MDKNKKLFVRPPQDPRFEHLRILKWNVRKKPTPEHGKYSIRFTLIMDDNTVLNRQKGGFPSKSSASFNAYNFLRNLFTCFILIVFP